jgi:excinuclease ABC subunit C
VDFEQLKNTAAHLPESPGVYQFIDKNGTVIYVGKAKNLRKRVYSYFSKNHEDPKTRILVRHIAQIKHILVDTETDALLLENVLIKKYQPKYNILLKDDKSYPWIVIKNEHFPRVEMTRNIIKDGSEYFGPYTSVQLVRTMLNMFKEIFKIRTCNLDLSPEKISQKKYKPCLEYHIKNCLAPCIGLQSEQDYNNNIEQIKKILRGRTRVVINYLKQLMQKYADNWEFEKAQEIKEKIQLLENYQSKSTVVNPELTDLDVFTILNENSVAYVNFLKIVEGKIIQIYSTEIKKALNEPKEEILAQAIIQIRNNKLFGSSNAKEILVPFEIDLPLKNVKITVPQKGDKKKLIELSLKNLMYYKEEKEKLKQKSSHSDKTIELLKSVQKVLQLKNIPIHIECFDNSNIQGSSPVASCVVFKYGQPSKKDYRKFSIKTVKGIDDFASMKEVVFRRYKRLIDENQPLPDLIVIDGGKGQLSAALESLKKLGLDSKIDIISIAKRLEEIYKPNEKYPIFLDRNSYALKLIQRIRDEAHRFGITYHRQKRSKQMIQPSLLKINGIGIKTYQKLISHFGSLEELQNASNDQIAKIVGKHKAQLIVNYLHSKNKQK